MLDWVYAPEYGWARLVLERGVGAVYAVAFCCAAIQFRGLLGSRGLLPIPRFVARRSFRAKPSIFHLHYSDRFFAAVCWSGAVLSSAIAVGLADRVPLGAAMLLWLLLWAAYLSIVNVGQIWYAFGWESLLLEVGFLMVFVGNDDVAPSIVVLILFWWLLFRVEFGAGLIKLRGDRCWRNLTCLNYHHETQPMPGPLSWFFHRLPRPLHRIEVAGNHVAQLVVPFGLFAPQPVASYAAGIVIVTQMWLVASGNFAWLNWLTILLACSAVDNHTFSRLHELSQPTNAPAAGPAWFGTLTLAVGVLIGVLSWRPAANLVSPRQRMNTTYDPLHLVNSYGAFGSVSRTRTELVFEGTDADRITDETTWLEYGFKGKPGDVRRWPRQCSPYHLRLDWAMWFVALAPGYGQPFMTRFCRALLDNDRDIVKLLRHNPFPDTPPRFIRVVLYRYRFTTVSELLHEHAWWHREHIGEYIAPITAAEMTRL